LGFRFAFSEKKGKCKSFPLFFCIFVMSLPTPFLTEPSLFTTPNGVTIYASDLGAWITDALIDYTLEMGGWGWSVWAGRIVVSVQDMDHVRGMVPKAEKVRILPSKIMYTQYIKT